MLRQSSFMQNTENTEVLIVVLYRCSINQSEASGWLLGEVVEGRGGRGRGMGGGAGEVGGGGGTRPLRGRGKV